jgi:hypothetical protein
MLMRFITGPFSKVTLSSGEVAKRLCSGLQSRVDGFDSRPRLQIPPCSAPRELVHDHSRTVRFGRCAAIATSDLPLRFLRDRALIKGHLAIVIFQALICSTIRFCFPRERYATEYHGRAAIRICSCRARPNHTDSSAFSFLSDFHIEMPVALHGPSKSGPGQCPIFFNDPEAKHEGARPHRGRGSAHQTNCPDRNPGSQTRQSRPNH